MRTQSMKLLSITIAILATCFSLSTLAAEPVKWVGYVQETKGYHTPEHIEKHNMEFIRKSDQRSYDIENSFELVKVHAEKDKVLLVEIEGEVTSRFLFWGGNLVVKSFKVLEELDVECPL